MLGVHHTDVTRCHEMRTNRYKARRGIKRLPSKGTSPQPLTTLLFCLTYETITPRHQVTSPNSRPQVNTHLVLPHDHTRDTNTSPAGSRTYPSTSPTGDIRCRRNQTISPIANSHMARCHALPPS